MKKSRFALFQSVIALLLCVSMLAGTTFAWFTDSVSSGTNTIAAGNLDIELEYLVDDVWKPVNQNTEVLDKEALWEPGYTEVAYLRIRNAGNLALKYGFGVGVLEETGSINVNGEPFYLSDHIRFGIVVSETPVTYGSRVDARNALTSSQLISQGEISNDDTLKAADKGRYVTLVVYMPEEIGNVANHATGVTPPEIKLGIQLTATQAEYESDSFGKDYDSGATLSGFNFPNNRIAATASAGVTTDESNKVADEVTLEDDKTSAKIPEGVLLDNGTKVLTLEVSTMEQSGANIVLNENEASVSLDVHVEGVSKDNTQPMEITIQEVAPKGLNMGNYKFYHVENGITNEMTLVASDAAFSAHNQFKYDPVTGDITLYMATFSEIAMVADTENAWGGNFDYSWYTNAVAPVDGEAATEYIIANADQLAAFGAIVGGMAEGIKQDSFSGKTVKLIADVNLGDAEAENNPNLIFYPIGYNSSDGKYEKTKVAVTTGFYNFSGTFDGNGHTISNFYHNTWEMKGDNNYYDASLQYYRDGMGLFGKVYGGTVKNLTVKNFSSDGEYTTTGVIAAYADGATFENIAIVGCNPRVYNIGNGGIVGCVGWYAKEAGLKTTFQNITVDNSNKISALWGSYDVPCGGIVGQYYTTSGQTSANKPANGGIHFDNCHISAQLDVNNDVCANYQYYAYRYAGMLIGSVSENKTIDGHVYPKMDGITAENSTVHFGTWNDYYYCEIIDNTTASYTHDYQMSRLEEIKAIDGTTITYLDDTTGTVPASGRANYVIVDYTKGHGTENATCYHFKDGAVWTHDMGGIQTGIDENGDGQDDLREDKQHLYLEFNNLVTGYGWGVTTKEVGELDGVTILDREVANSVEKFETKFTGDFLYRVGNQNTVSVGSLFKYKEGVTESGSGVVVTIDKVDENSDVSGTFTPSTTKNADGSIKWEDGKIQFSGTGVVKVTIQDYNFCTPTVLMLEVVDAVNATTATSATKNNVVLLQNCGFSSLEVSGGYTLYGNGFTMTCGSDSASLSFGEFVKLDNGTLDNVQIVCPNYDYAALYNSQLESKNNRSETSNGTTRYFNAKSAVLASGNSIIQNSRISGGRATLYASSGNIVVDNSHLELGAVATVIISSANSIVFRDVTLIQKPTASTYDSSKVLMGMSVLYMCDADGNATDTTIEGAFVQRAWADANCTAYMPEGTSSIASTVLEKSNYTHTIDGQKSVNLGFAYMSEGASVGQPNNIVDNRSNKNSVPYDYESVKATVSASGVNVSISTYVYTYKNTNGTDALYYQDSGYKPTVQGDVITVTYSDVSDGLTYGKSFGTNGWVYELNVDLDKLPGYELDFSKMTMIVNGNIVTDFKVNGGDKPTSPVKVSAGGTSYTLSATNDSKTHTAAFVVTGVETTKDAPSLINAIGGTKITADKVNWGASKCVVRTADDRSTNYTVTAPVLEGLIVRYWSVANSNYVDLKLTELTPNDSTALNGTNNYWEYEDPNGDFKLKITNTAYVHDGNKIFAMPVSYNKNLYFVSTSKDGLVSTGSGARVLKIKYEFTDNNGGELSFEKSWSQAYDKNNTLNYKDLTGIADGCVTPDTLITLADGSQVRVDSLKGDEQLLVWNLETGKYDTAPIVFVDNDAEDTYEIIHLYFSDGSDVKVISEHGFFDLDLGEYVYIDAYNYADYIGHRFVTEGDIKSNNWNVVTLDEVVIETEVTTAWSPVTFEHLCYYTNGVLSMPGGIEGLFNIFEVDTDLMRYDAVKMQKDIETFGLFTIEDFGGMITEDAFNAFNGAYLKVAIAKGILTWEDIAYMAERYIPLMK